MKVGLLARGENRGLGIQTWEWYRHMTPDRTLLIDLGDLARNFVQHPERFPDATVAAFDGALDEGPCREWLRGLDVVYTAETFYDWRFVEWAAAEGVATVCHVNPEFYRHGSEPDLPHPNAWWGPSSWRLDTIPGAVHVPVPVPIDRWPIANSGPREGGLRWLHVVGHRAMADRAGTRSVIQALRTVRRPVDFTMRTQDHRLPHAAPPRHVRLTVTCESIDDYWRLYDDVDVVVIPRRYGGLCLPTLEAMGAGCAVVMTDAEPQRTDWPPVVTIPSTKRQSIETPAGKIPTVDLDPRLLARLIDDWTLDPTPAYDRGRAGRTWAVAHSWEALRPTIVEALADACR